MDHPAALTVRMLVVVAHPDDEAYGCGSVLAMASAAGHETHVVCATRGEAGESRIATDDLAALRAAELREAARVLGVRDVRLLAHRDSGMTGDPEAGTLAAADPGALAAEVGAILAELRPDVVVTLDGSDGHRDHQAIRDATLAAVDAAPDPPPATYLVCLARSSMERWQARMREVGGGESYLDPDLGTPDDLITHVLDVRAHVDARWAAIRAHASQASPFDELPEDLQLDFLGSERLRLVRGTDAVWP